MSNKVDMSLDDIISKNKSGFSFGRGRGRGRGGRRGGRGMSGPARGRGGGSRGRGASAGPRSVPYKRGNVNGVWTHDMHYRGGGGGGAGAGGITTARVPSTGLTKLNITNLDFGVSDSDIQELFTEFGAMRSAAIHYDKSGRSLGTAHVTFERRSDALKAIRQYNGVHLDGRPMNINIDGPSGGVANNASSTFSPRSPRGIRGGRMKRLQGAPRPIGGGMRGSTRGSRGARGGRGGRGVRGVGGGGGGRGRRGAKQKVPTAEELDAELDAYVIQSNE